MMATYAVFLEEGVERVERIYSSDQKVTLSDYIQVVFSHSDFLLQTQTFRYSYAKTISICRHRSYPSYMKL